MDCGIAGDLWVLLFTGIEEEGRLGQSMDTARNGWHIHWHTSLSGQTLGGL